MKRFALVALATLALACLGPPVLAHDGKDMTPVLVTVEKVFSVDTVSTMPTVFAAECGCHVAVSVTNPAPEVMRLVRSISPVTDSVSAHITNAIPASNRDGRGVFTEVSRLPDPLRLRVARIMGRNHPSR